MSQHHDTHYDTKMYNAITDTTMYDVITETLSPSRCLVPPPPLAKVLAMCSQPETRALVGSWKEGGKAAATLSTLAQALDLSADEAKDLVRQQPVLLTLPG